MNFRLTTLRNMKIHIQTNKMTLYNIRIHLFKVIELNKLDLHLQSRINKANHIRLKCFIMENRILMAEANN